MTEKIDKFITHPVESIFDIEPGSTMITTNQPRSTELVTAPIYDEKDEEIEENLQEIYDKSMDFFDDMQQEVEVVEAQYKARTAEVCMQMLTVALNAAKQKRHLKEHKDILRAKVGTDNTFPPAGGVVNNTQIITTTADLIKSMAQQRDPVNNHNESVVVEEQQPAHTRTKVPRTKPQQEVGESE
jgi:hypothetical protein